MTRKHPRILLGCATLVGLCCMTAVFTAIVVNWQQARVSRQVEKAVQASFPDFCDNPDQKLIAKPITRPPSFALNRYWDVSCEPGSWTTGPAMTVDVKTCSVLIPWYGIPEWHIYSSMFEDGQRMSVCP